MLECYKNSYEAFGTCAQLFTVFPLFNGFVSGPTQLINYHHSPINMFETHMGAPVQLIDMNRCYATGFRMLYVVYRLDKVNPIFKPLEEVPLESSLWYQIKFTFNVNIP